MNESGAELGVIRTASTEPELTDRVSLTTKAVTNAGITITVPEVTMTGSLGNEGAVGLEVGRELLLCMKPLNWKLQRRILLLAKAAKLIGKQMVLAGLKDDPVCVKKIKDDPALDEPQPPSRDMIGNVQVGNAGETVATVMEPSQCDAADVDGSVGSTRYGPVGARDSIVEGGVAHDKSVTPVVSCTLGVVARSIGRSERTDVICYTRRIFTGSTAASSVALGGCHFHGAGSEPREADLHNYAYGPSAPDICHAAMPRHPVRLVFLED
ncbi:hypothetical protein EJB05_08005, partial [Eragrostis curvula]